MRLMRPSRCLLFNSPACFNVVVEYSFRCLVRYISDVYFYFQEWTAKTHFACFDAIVSLFTVGKRAPFTTDSQCHTTPRLLMSVAGYPQFPHHAMIAGLIGGYCVWGNYSSINYQIVLYLTSRVFIGVVQRLMQHPAGAERALSSSAKTVCSVPQFVRDRTYSLCTAMIWAMVMFLFEDSPEVLHPSLKNSMDEIYRFRPWSSLLPDSSP